MDFFNYIKEFFTVASQNNYDLAVVYEQTPQGVYSTFFLLLVVLAVVFYFIRRDVKIKSAVKLSNNIVSEKSFENFDRSLEQLIVELPKRGEKLANSINENKELILSQELQLIKGFDISKKIDCYVNISTKFSRLEELSKKYNIQELTSFFNEKSKLLLSENLFNEIKAYILTCAYDENSFENIKAILKYSNQSSDKLDILAILKTEISKLSFEYNVGINEFAKQISKDDSKEFFEFIDKKIKAMLEDSETKISSKVLKYYFNNEQKSEVYNYLRNLSNQTHLQQLYFEMFGKLDDIDLDLAFVSNPTVINEDYKNYLDNKFTFNWSDLALIKKILDAPRVLETIGHIHYRNVLERIEKLENQKDNNKAIADALEIARRAEFIANEAKQLANKNK